MDTWVEGGLKKGWSFHGQPHFMESAQVPSLGLGAACRLGIRPSSLRLGGRPSSLHTGSCPRSSGGSRGCLGRSQRERYRDRLFLCNKTAFFPHVLSMICVLFVVEWVSTQAGAGTELRAVGALNRGAEPRGWYCYRTLMCIWLCSPSWCRHRADGGWPSEQRRRATRVVLLPDPDVHMAVPPRLVQAPS
ncbi:hypothetical protein AAC387_Pa04g1321 [Persea americana]